MTTNVTVNLDDEFRGLLTSQGRRDFLTVSILRELGDLDLDGAHPRYVMLANYDDPAGGTHTLEAKWWAREAGDLLAPAVGGDEEEERDLSARSFALLQAWRERHANLWPTSDLMYPEIVDAGQVVDGVIALREDPQLAEIAAEPRSGQVKVVIDVDALYDGKKSVRDVTTTRRTPPPDAEADRRRRSQDDVDVLEPAPIDLSSIDISYAAAANNGAIDGTSRERAVDVAVDQATAASGGRGRRWPSRRDRARAAQRWEQNREYVETRQQDLDRD